MAPSWPAGLRWARCGRCRPPAMSPTWAPCWRSACCWRVGGTSIGWRCEAVTDRSTPPVLARPASAGGAAGLPGGGLLPRVLPTGLYVGRARVLVERSLVVNRPSWMTVFSGFFEPVFYLLALGLRLGALIGGEIAGP